MAEILVGADEVEESPDPESAENEGRSADDHDGSPHGSEHVSLAICSLFTRVVEGGPASESGGLVFIDHLGLLCCGYIINISEIKDSQERNLKNLEKLMETSVEKQQLKIIVDAIKKIVTNPRTPNWVKNPLEEAVKTAKALSKSDSAAASVTAQVKEKTSVQALETAQMEVGATCVDALDPKDECLYQVIDKDLEIDHVQLWTIKVTKGDKKTPAGTIMHNVPENYLRAVRIPE